MAEVKDQIVRLKDTVNFVVEYSKDFKGKKHLKDKQVLTLHKLHAQRLEAKGVGKVSK